MSQQTDDLAYGRYHESDRGASSDGSRGLSDTFKKLRDTYKSHSSSQHSGQPYGQPGYQEVWPLSSPLFLLRHAQAYG